MPSFSLPQAPTCAYARPNPLHARHICLSYAQSWGCHIQSARRGDRATADAEVQAAEAKAAGTSARLVVTFPD